MRKDFEKNTVGMLLIADVKNKVSSRVFSLLEQRSHALKQ
jgi:hypothetical protein